MMLLVLLMIAHGTRVVSVGWPVVVAVGIVGVMPSILDPEGLVVRRRGAMTAVLMLVRCAARSRRHRRSLALFALSPLRRREDGVEGCELGPVHLGNFKRHPRGEKLFREGGTGGGIDFAVVECLNHAVERCLMRVEREVSRIQCRLLLGAEGDNAVVHQVFASLCSPRVVSSSDLYCTRSTRLPLVFFVFFFYVFLCSRFHASHFRHPHRDFVWREVRRNVT